MHRKFYGEEYADLKREKAENFKLETLGDLYGIFENGLVQKTAYSSCQAELASSAPSPLFWFMICLAARSTGYEWTVV